MVNLAKATETRDYSVWPRGCCRLTAARMIGYCGRCGPSHHFDDWEQSLFMMHSMRVKLRMCLRGLQSMGREGMQTHDLVSL